MRKRLEEIDLLATAYLFGRDQKNQQQIAEILQLSQATVSRLLQRARREYLRHEMHFLAEKVDDATMRQIHHRVSRSKLGEKLEGIALAHGHARGPVLRVFSSGGNEDTAEAWDRRLASFGRAAAPFIRDLLRRATHCGISWGQTLGNVVGALGELPPPARPAGSPGLRVIPLCGEPLGNEPTNQSSSVLAATLATHLNGSDTPALSLGMVPAFIPSGFSRAELAGVWKLIGLVKAYAQIMGDRPAPAGRAAGGRAPRPAAATPLVERLDMILTSVGPSERPLGYGSGELLRTGDVSTAELKELIVGDIAGVLIARPGLSAARRTRLERVNSRWTGVTCDQLAACARSAAQGDPAKGPPGVVVVAIGRSKASFVYEAVTRGLINQLVIDEDLESELGRVVRRVARAGRETRARAVSARA